MIRVFDLDGRLLDRLISPNHAHKKVEGQRADWLQAPGVAPHPTHGSIKLRHRVETARDFGGLIVLAPDGRHVVQLPRARLRKWRYFQSDAWTGHGFRKPPQGQDTLAHKEGRLSIATLPRVLVLHDVATLALAEHRELVILLDRATAARGSMDALAGLLADREILTREHVRSLTQKDLDDLAVELKSALTWLSEHDAVKLTRQFRVLAEAIQVGGPLLSLLDQPSQSHYA